MAIEYPFYLKIVKFSLYNGYFDSAYYISDFTLQGSSNGNDWVDIEDFTNGTQANEKTTFTVTNSNYYKFYRLYTHTKGYVILAEMELNEAYYVE